MDALSLLALNPRSGQPIYRQIVEQVERAIATGNMTAGQSLPSVRNLAKSLAVNPMTVSKAYNMLENSGAVLRRPGIGMAVAETTVSPSDVLKPEIKAVVERARTLEVDLKELNALIAKEWKA